MHLNSNLPDPVCRYYGCGLVFPEAVEGCRVLDLSSGSGRDCFVLTKLVGSEGFVTGVDMTQEQVCVCVCVRVCVCACVVSLCLYSNKCAVAGNIIARMNC